MSLSKENLTTGYSRQGSEPMSEMSKVNLYAAIRQDLRAGLSKRAIERKYRVGWRTVSKAMESVWPEPRKEYPHRPQKLDPYKPFIDEVLRADLNADLDPSHRQRHTATYIHRWLAEEHGMTGVSYQRVSAYVRARKPQLQGELANHRRTERLIGAAGFPARKELSGFEFDADPTVDSAMIRTLADCDWVREGLPLRVIGGSGTGKSHLLIALGIEAAKAGFRVRYTSAAMLLARLTEAAEGGRLANTIARYSGVDLLCIDDLDHAESDGRSAELLLRVLEEREAGTSVAITSERDLSSWSGLLPEDRTAIIDLLTRGGITIRTGTRRYRRARSGTTTGTDSPP